jgi:acetyltransferase
MIRFSQLLIDCPEIVECDVNPLEASPERVVAVDARIVWDPVHEQPHDRPFPHLAIHPYPGWVQRRVQLNDRNSVLLRPIRPKDEPAWRQMLNTCSRETIRSRFRGMIRTDLHEIAASFCTIDYDRELAIVAELGEGEESQLIAVGRLVADPDHERAEYAVLVADPWQHRGLGLQLTEFCVDVAVRWGVKSLDAETGRENVLMLSVFRELGFETVNSEDGIVSVRKRIDARTPGIGHIRS